MNCGHCSDCKWWEQDFWRYMLPSENHGLCRLTMTDQSGEIFIFPDSKAQSYGERGCGLVTADDFGCIQFQSKQS